MLNKINNNKRKENKHFKQAKNNDQIKVGKKGLLKLLESKINLKKNKIELKPFKTD